MRAGRAEWLGQAAATEADPGRAGIRNSVTRTRSVSRRRRTSGRGAGGASIFSDAARHSRQSNGVRADDAARDDRRAGVSDSPPANDPRLQALAGRSPYIHLRARDAAVGAADRRELTVAGRDALTRAALSLRSVDHGHRLIMGGGDTRRGRHASRTDTAATA